jgi:hypothetical protein
VWNYLRLPPPPRDGRCIDPIPDGLVDGRPADGLYGLPGLAIGCVGLGGLVPGGLVPAGGLCAGGGG